MIDTSHDPDPSEAVFGPAQGTEPAAPRERAIAAAERLFARHGWHATTMDELARELGMSKRTLYEQFHSKEDLMEVLLERMGERIFRLGSQIIRDQRRDYLGRLRAFGQFVAGVLARFHPTMLRDLQRHYPARYRQLEAVRHRNATRFFEMLFEEGLRRGMVRTDLDASYLARFVVVTIESVIHPEALERLRIGAARAMSLLLSLLFEGLLTEKAQRSYAKNPQPGDALRRLGRSRIA